MQQLEGFKKPEGIIKVIESINAISNKPIKIMEICGTHTMAIAKAGLKSLLNSNIKLISGPGCPVCVTPQDRIDRIIDLSKQDNIIIATYGDMLRVPGTLAKDSLQSARTMGAQVEIVYSAMDAIELAENNPNSEVVFLGIGFETTAPSTGIAIKVALERKIQNFSVLSMHKLCEPVLRSLIEEPGFDIDGFICPGNVAIVIGEKGFGFLSGEFKLPAVITGFEGGDLVTSIYKIVEMINAGESRLINEYSRIVSREGNQIAKAVMKEVFEYSDDLWRGIGMIKLSGLKIKEKYNQYDAVCKFNITLGESNPTTACSCGQVIKGKMLPEECILFARQCTPDNPVGPCMVSSEGACAARLKYE